MTERTRPSRGLELGLTVLALLAAVVLFGPALLGGDPETALDPPVASLAPPAARFETLRLTDGYELAAERVVGRDGSFLLQGPGEERRVAAARVDPVAPRGEIRYWLGSDALGRDVAVRLLHGGRVSLAVAAAAVTLSLLVGVPLGLLAGLSRGLADRALLNGVEAAQAFPRLFLLVALVAAVPAGVTTTVVLLGLTGWMPIARLVRAETRRLRNADFVLAARAAGIGPIRLALRHLLPNVATPVAIEASLAMGAAITVEAALSFLGLGVPPPTPSWGNLIADGRELVASAWWIATFPGLALIVTVIACNLVGEGLRDRLDPRRAGPAGPA